MNTNNAPERIELLPCPVTQKPAEFCCERREVLAMSAQDGETPFVFYDYGVKTDGGLCLPIVKNRSREEAVRIWNTRNAMQPQVSESDEAVVSDIAAIYAKPWENAELAKQLVRQALSRHRQPAAVSDTEWTPDVKKRCEGRCGDVGDPPCYRLPEMTSDAPKHLKPCAECLTPAAVNADAVRMREALEKARKVISDEIHAYEDPEVPEHAQPTFSFRLVLADIDAALSPETVCGGE